MSGAEDADAQRVADEVARCERLSAEQTGHLDRTYYRERARVLRTIPRGAAVEFLREATLRALAGEPPTGRLTRWAELHTLEAEAKGQPVHSARHRQPTIMELMEQGLRDRQRAEGDRGRG